MTKFYILVLVYGHLTIQIVEYQQSTYLLTYALATLKYLNFWACKRLLYFGILGVKVEFLSGLAVLNISFII